MTTSASHLNVLKVPQIIPTPTKSTLICALLQLEVVINKIISSIFLSYCYEILRLGTKNVYSLMVPQHKLLQMRSSEPRRFGQNPKKVMIFRIPELSSAVRTENSFCILLS